MPIKWSKVTIKKKNIFFSKSWDENKLGKYWIAKIRSRFPDRTFPVSRDASLGTRSTASSSNNEASGLHLSLMLFAVVAAAAAEALVSCSYRNTGLENGVTVPVVCVPVISTREYDLILVCFFLFFFYNWMDLIHVRGCWTGDWNNNIEVKDSNLCHESVEKYISIIEKIYILLTFYYCLITMKWVSFTSKSAGTMIEITISRSKTRISVMSQLRRTFWYLKKFTFYYYLIIIRGV